MLFRSMLDDLRTNMGVFFLHGIGQGAKLSEGWRRGNPQWELAHARVSEAVEQEEARAGPIFVVRREDIAASFNPPWSAAEIETATEILSSDYGRKFLRLLDLTQTPTLVKQMSGLSGLSDGAKARMRERGITVRL